MCTIHSGPLQLFHDILVKRSLLNYFYQGIPLKTSDLVVKALEHEGVKYIFGIPGEENLDFLNSLRNSSIQLILTRHEQAAGFMAATYGRLTGTPGVCMSTLGPGATNLVTAAAYAQLGGMPMIMITGQKPITKSKQGRFQIVDVVEMMRPLTKMAKQVVHEHTVTAIIREAFRLAVEERPGAIHIELPEDISRENSDAEIYEPSSFLNPVADSRAIMDAVQKIHNARSPLILLGAAADRRKAHDAIRFLIEKTGIPFFTTQLGKGVVDERSPLCLGTAALSSNDCVHMAINRSDLIINIGHDIIEKPPFFMTKGGFDVIAINFLPANVDEVYFPQVEIVGDIAHSVTELSRLIERQPHWDFAYMLQIKKRLDATIEEGTHDNSFPVSPPRLVSIIRNVMPHDGMITLDNGMYKIWFTRNYQAYDPNSILLDNSLASMGAGLPSAIASKIVYPEKKVIAICGDGGFMMNSQELETAVRLNLDLLVLIVNDRSYGMIKWKQKDMGFEEFGLDFSNPDFVEYARSYGAEGHRVGRTEDLPPLINKCFAEKGVHVIDVPVDYSRNKELLSQCMLGIDK
jgi:acetolactate synthase-1/2/3 large subunit